MTRVTILCFLLGLSVTSSGWPINQAYVEERGNEVRLGNDYLERVVKVSDGIVSTRRFQNKLTGRTYALRGGEFQLQLIYERVGYSFGSENPLVLTSSDFRVSDHALQDLAGGGKRVVYRLELLSRREIRTGLAAELIYEVRPDEFFMRQSLKLRTTNAGTYFIDSISVAKNDWGTDRFTLGGFGQPLFGPDIFLGLEYPSSINTTEGSEVSLCSYVGENVTSQGFTSEPVVIGVAREGAFAIHTAFFNYVNRIRAAPVRPHIVYNSWYDLQRLVMNHQNTLDRVKRLDERLAKGYGVHLDSFVLDDGWDDMNDLWAVDGQRFPNGFRDLVEALKGIDSKLGLWFGPIGGYDQRAMRIEAGRRKGMEITTNGEHLCLAGTHYSRFFRERLLTLVKEYGVNHFKLDGVPFGCNAPDHGHPLGIYSREADVRSFIDILQAVRQANPEIFLNVTTSMWLSPWWLRYADSVWMGGEDYARLETVPALTPRQSSLNYRDLVLYNDYKRHQVQFPMSSLMTQSVIQGKFLRLGVENESLDDWNDHLVNFFGVGSQLNELYISPELLNPQEWDSLGHILQWARKNAHPLLDNSTFILGDPEKRQAYGYVHDSPESIIILVRNPFVRPVEVNVKLDETSGIQPREGAFLAEVLYPFREVLGGALRYGDTLWTDLGAYEQRVIELRPNRPDSVRVIGVPYTVKLASKGETGFRIYAPAGSTRRVELAGTAAGENVILDGNSMELKDGRLLVRFGEPGRLESQPSFTLPALNVSTRDGAGTTLRLAFSLALPGDFPETQLGLLVESAQRAGSSQAEGTDAGRPLVLRANGEKDGPWQWFVADLKAGSHRFEFRVHFPTGLDGPVKLTGWMLAKRTLVSRDLGLVLNPGRRLDVPPENLLPADSGVERKTYALFEQVVR